MAAIYFSLMSQPTSHRADTSTKTSVSSLFASRILLDLKNSEQSLFKAVSLKPVSRPLTETEEELALSDLREIASKTQPDNRSFARYCHMIIEKKDDNSTSLIISASLLYLHAQKHKQILLAYYLYNQFGQRLIIYYREHYVFLRSTHLGLSNIDFDELIYKEIDYAQTTESTDTDSIQSMFDALFFQRRSSEFLDFWSNQNAPYDNFEECLTAFPYRGAINYLPAQLKLWNEFQKDPRTKNFPIQEIWRFGIDRDVEELGPCAFETEPGYMKAFLQGMIFAFESAHDPKNDQWYIRLHKKACSHSLFPSIDGLYDVRHIELWDPLRSSFSPFLTALRTSSVAWNFENLDHDPLGLTELRKRPSIRIDDMEKTIESKKYKADSIAVRLYYVMQYYQKLVKDAADNPAKRLLVYLAQTRQLSLDRFFCDANARSSHLVFLSWIKSDYDLPFPLLADQNIFDANCPESVVYRYLEGCVNFLQDGKADCSPKTDQVKRLQDLDLSAYPELDALKNELKPLVVNKKWAQVVPTYRRKIQAKRSQREYIEDVETVAKRVLFPA